MSTRKSTRATVVVLAAAWLLTTVVVDVLTPHTLRLATLYAIAPVLACAALSPAITAVYAGAALTLAVWSGRWNHVTGDAQQVARLIDVVLVGAAAIIAAAVRVRMAERQAQLSTVAETAQRAILPTLPPRTAVVATATRYEAAGKDSLVGGDLYDCYQGRAFSRFIIGDVRGKGIDAVEQAARVIRAFRQSAHDPAGLVAVAGEMDEYLQPFLADEEFVTAVLLELRASGRLTVLSCGHPPPLLVTSAGATFLDAPAGLPLGWGDLYEVAEASWVRGDRLLLYTDGLVEARDATGEFFPLLQRADLLAGPPVDLAADALLTAVRAHVPLGRQLADDLALVLLENVVDSAPAPVRRRARQPITVTLPEADDVTVPVTAQERGPVPRSARGDLAGSDLRSSRPYDPGARVATRR